MSYQEFFTLIGIIGGGFIGWVKYSDKKTEHSISEYRNEIKELRNEVKLLSEKISTLNAELAGQRERNRMLEMQVQLYETKLKLKENDENG